MATRWGIVTAGNICSDFVTALNLLPKEEHCVEAVAARDLGRAKEFANKFGIKRFYGSYEELACDKDLDVIYVGNVHNMHYPMCKLYLGAGYNVLCEKPLMVNSAQCREVVELARSKGVFLMEALWSRFFPIYDELRKLLASGSVGQPQFVSANLGFPAMQVKKLLDKTTAGGALLITGCYTVQFAQMVYNHEKPEVVASGFLNENSGVDEATTMVLKYSGHRTAVLSCSLRCSLDQQATICTDKEVADKQGAVIKIENFWSPDKMCSPSGVIEHKLPECKSPLNFVRSEGLVYEAQAVRHCLQNGMTEHPNMTLDMSLQICEILDEVRKQTGYVLEDQ